LYIIFVVLIRPKPCVKCECSNIYRYYGEPRFLLDMLFSSERVINVWNSVVLLCFLSVFVSRIIVCHIIINITKVLCLTVLTVLHVDLLANSQIRVHFCDVLILVSKGGCTHRRIQDLPGEGGGTMASACLYRGSWGRAPSGVQVQSHW